jgi:diguanylate cyclase (GGDEF)-like protein/putative nucleotidyltransferase with HDIG domain
MNKKHHPAYTAYLYSVIVAGTAILLASMCAVLRIPVSYYCLVIALLALLTSAFPIKIPQTDLKISVGDTFFFTNLLLFGTDVGVITAALQGLIGSLRAKSARRRLEFTLFNVGALALAARISGSIFYSLYRHRPLFEAGKVSFLEIIAPIGALAVVHYLLNSASVAAIIALDVRRNVYLVWRKNLSWTVATYFANASVAALIAFNVSLFGLGVLGVAAPIVLMTYATYNTYRQKIESHICELRELNSLYMRTVESLALAVDAKDQTTHGHIRRVRAYAVGLARLHGVTDPTELLAIETGALLHDIGKLAIEDFILNKPGKLSQQEFERMKIHSAAGEEILQQIQFPFPVAKYVRSHHERWNGTGYPDNLKGEQIPLGARILTIADSYDAIRSSRPYKPQRGREEAAAIMRQDAGTAFDPTLAELFVQNIDNLEAEAVAAAREIPEMSYRNCVSSCTPMVPEDRRALDPIDFSFELVSLYEFCAIAARSLNLEDILSGLDRRIRRLVPSNTCVFFLQASDSILEAAYANGTSAELFLRLRIGLGRGVSGWAAAHHRPMLNAAARLEFDEPNPVALSLRHALAVPLMLNGDCLGTISVYGQEHITYSERDSNLLQAVARQAAPAIAWARSRGRASEQRWIDPVTGVHTAGYLTAAGSALIDSCAHTGNALHLVFLHLTNLARVVDLFGHERSETVFREFAETLRADTRGTDLLARFGPDGFVLLIAGIDSKGLAQRLQRLEKSVKSQLVSTAARIECRIGVASYPEDGDCIQALLEKILSQVGRLGDSGDFERPGNALRVLHFPIS